MPQGAVISPLLSNVYLHHAFDLWVEQWRRRHARGDVIVVRYADDSVLGFQYRDDAEAFQRALAARLETFGLSLHSEKTRLARFGRFAASDAREAGGGKAGTFDFLGFTHIGWTDRHRWFQVRRHTSKSRQAAILARIREELRRRRHQPIARTGAWLRRVLQGFINYFGVPFNSSRLSALCHEARRDWFRSLRRRSQRTRLTWRCFRPMADYRLPRPRIVHPFPDQRFDAMRSRQEPDALAAHVRICAGGAA